MIAKKRNNEILLKFVFDLSTKLTPKTFIEGKLQCRQKSVKTMKIQYYDIKCIKFVISTIRKLYNDLYTIEYDKSCFVE